MTRRGVDLRAPPTRRESAKHALLGCAPKATHYNPNPKPPYADDHINDILLCTLANTYQYANNHTIMSCLLVIARALCLFVYRIQTITIRLFVIVH